MAAPPTLHAPVGEDWNSKPIPINVLYVVTFPLGKEPEQFATPTAVRRRWSA